MNFCCCTINTADLDRSVTFYTELVGLEVATRFSPQPSLKIVFLKDDHSTPIEIIQNDNSVQLSVKEGISICFEVQSLDETLELVKSKNIPILAGPFVNPGVKFFNEKDPDGVTVQFLERLNANH